MRGGVQRSIPGALHLSERIAAWPGNNYNFVVIELESRSGEVARAVAYTMQKPSDYIRGLCKAWIKGGRIQSNAINDGIVEREINAAIDSALSPQDAPQCAVSDFPAIAVSEDAERINAHTERTGETIEAFIRRAIADTIKRDTVLLKMGMNPAQEQG